MPFTLPFSPASRRRGARGLLALAALICCPSIAIAAVTVTLRSSPSLTLDITSPCTVGPRAAYVQARITNTNATAITPVVASLSGLAAGFSLAGGQVVAQAVGPIAAGASADVFWLVSYPCTVGTASPVTFTITNGSGTTYATLSTTVTTASSTQGAAGGNIVTQALSTNVIGATVNMTVKYTFGRVRAGGTYDMQPAGNTSFAASCLQLLSTLVTQSTATQVAVNTANTLFFTAAANDNATGTVTMRYSFRSLCSAGATTATPYATQVSAGASLHTANSTTIGALAVPAATNPFTSVKTVTPDTLSDGGTVTYSVTITNSSAVASTLDSVADILPINVTFGVTNTSGPTAANSVSRPATNAVGQVAWTSIPRQYYAVPAGGTFVISYTASVPATVGVYQNNASAYVGVTSVTAANIRVTVRRLADVSLTKSGPTSGITGDTLRFILTTTNAGPSAARTVTVIDSLPPQLTFVRGSRAATAAGAVVTWPAVDSMTVGQVVTDTVFARITSAGSGTNIGAISTPRLDPTPANNNGSQASARVALTTTTAVVTVSVLPKGGAVIKRLAGTAYSQVFTVQNTSPQTEGFDLLMAYTPSASQFVQRDSLTGTGITVVTTDSARASIPSTTTLTYTLWYTVPPGDTVQNEIVMRAKSLRTSSLADTGYVTIRRTWPAFTIAKSATPVTTPLPGNDVAYQIAYSNQGEFPAHNVVLTDPVPSQLQFKVGSASVTYPSGVSGTLTYSSDGGATWTYTPASGGCGAPVGYDGCVNRVRLVFAVDLPAGAAGSSGVLSLRARIR